MVAWGSNLGWVKTGDRTGSRRTAVDVFNRYGMGVGVGDETVVHQELGVNKVVRRPRIYQHLNGDGGDGDGMF